jgi:hypothetical protein
LRYKLRDKVTLDQVDDEYVLMAERGDVAVLNQIAGYMLGLVLENDPSDVVASKIAKIYEVDSSTASEDLEKLLDELIDNDFLERC